MALGVRLLIRWVNLNPILRYVLLLPRLGIPDYCDKTEDEWLKQIAAGIPVSRLCSL